MHVVVSMFQSLRNEVYSVKFQSNLFRSNWPHSPSSRSSQGRNSNLLEAGSRAE